jgi:hypothetical protein
MNSFQTVMDKSRQVLHPLETEKQTLESLLRAE